MITGIIFFEERCISNNSSSACGPKVWVVGIPGGGEREMKVL